MGGDNIIGVKKIENRNETLDAIKGEAALLVIAGHIIQFIIYKNCKENAFKDVIFCLIYSFHMPLFMFVSGYLSYKNNFEFNSEWLLKRMKKLLIPFCSWIIIDWVFKIVPYRNENTLGLGDEILGVLLQPDKGYWFLVVLFYNCGILAGIEFIIKNVERKFSVGVIYLRTAIIILSILICKYIGKIGICGLNLLGWYSFYYLGGYWIRYILEICPNNKFVMLKSNKCLFIMLFLTLAIFWRFGEEPAFSEYLYSFLDNGSSGYLLCKMILILYSYAVPILGIGTSFLLMRDLPESHIREGIVICGQYTLEIYILQMFFIKNYTGSIVIDVIISLIFSVVIPIGIAKIADYIPVLNFICFGKGKPQICKK